MNFLTIMVNVMVWRSNGSVVLPLIFRHQRQRRLQILVLTVKMRIYCRSSSLYINNHTHHFIINRHQTYNILHLISFSDSSPSCRACCSISICFTFPLTTVPSDISRMKELCHPSRSHSSDFWLSVLCQTLMLRIASRL